MAERVNRETALGAAFSRALADPHRRIPPRSLPPASPSPGPTTATVTVEVAVTHVALSRGPLPVSRIVPRVFTRKAQPSAESADRDRMIADRLEDLRARIARNVPRHGDPERFHIEKSEITNDLTKLARAIRAGRVPSE